MLNLIKSIFGLEPPLGKWIDYQHYQNYWRETWQDKTKIIEYDRSSNRIKLAKLSTKEMLEAEIRDNQ